ncbi:MAG TPA: CPBP family glutamic-type intramembrane protease [Polyangiales bacterium]|nr:CPBP family glutamic-type intramembrane protease [Polyangiales bacterium]
MPGKASGSMMANLKKRPDPLTSVALTIPVFLTYHLGILATQARSGVDVVSNTIFGTLKASAPVYAVVTLCLALVVATVTWVEERRGATQTMSLWRVIGEGALAAVVVVAALSWATNSVLESTNPAKLQELKDLSVGEMLVLAAGTAFHEEIIFRALLCTLLSVILLKVFRVSKGVALGIAIALSSVAFALIQNWGPFGQEFVADHALYRLVLGVCFAGLFLFRGFAVAVYTHVFFEILVYFLYL